MRRQPSSRSLRRHLRYGTVLRQVVLEIVNAPKLNIAASADDQEVTIRAIRELRDIAEQTASELLPRDHLAVNLLGDVATHISSWLVDWRSPNTRIVVHGGKYNKYDNMLRHIHERAERIAVIADEELRIANEIRYF